MATPNSAVTRSTVTQEQYAAPEFPKSGFSMPYSRHTSFILGRLHISGVHWTMPSDKIYGKNSGDLTFNRIVTPMVTPVDAGQYNFYLPLRAVDNTFEQGMTPTELNAMSANWHTPKCNTRDLVSKLFSAYGIEKSFIVLYWDGIRESIRSNPNVTLQEIFLHLFPDADPQDVLDIDIYASLINSAIDSLTSPTGTLYLMAKDMYLTDALKDIAINITNKVGSASNPVSLDSPAAPFFESLLDVLLTPWLGRYSYFGELKYNYIRPLDIKRMVNSIGITVPDFFEAFDDTPLCEYPLRVMYAIWYERFRDVHLEKVSPTLPYYRNFGSTSIFDLDAGGNLCYLIYRIRSWYDDPFTAAQVDDISRHVYAPVSSVSQTAVANHMLSENNLDANVDVPNPNNFISGGLHKPAIYTLGYRDQVTGENKQVFCPVPSNINDYLSNLDTSFQSVFGLDLNTLRQSQMLERYLKRNYVFGDDYPDRMLAHYNSRVSDMRINKPELIGQSLNQSDMKQQVANISAGESQAGDRVATSTVQFGGDDYSTFCEEFGIVINLLSLMPHAIYDGVDAHLLLDMQSDFPLPEFATNNEEFGRKMEIASSGLSSSLQTSDGDIKYIFGRYPAYHIWRGRVDEVGGMFLDELQDAIFRRFWGLYSEETTPKLNYEFLHCRPNLGMFANTNRYDSQVYGTVNHEFFCERVLPTPVEVI